MCIRSYTYMVCLINQMLNFIFELTALYFYITLGSQLCTKFLIDKYLHR